MQLIIPDDPELPRTLSISVSMHLDVYKGEDIVSIAKAAVQAYQDHLEYGGIAGRCDWITPAEEFDKSEIDND